MKNKLFILFLIITVTISGIYFIEYNIKNNTNFYIFLKNKIPYKTKKLIRNKIKNFSNYFNDEKLVLEKLNDIKDPTFGQFKIFNNKLLNFKGPRAYMASDKNNFFLITGDGSLYFTKIDNFSRSNDVSLNKIKSNIPKIFKNYRVDDSDELERSSMIKSILIKDDIIYISATVKENSNCFKQKIFKAKINLNKIFFNEFFQVKDCRTFYDDTSGGNIILYKENKILYTLGDWKSCQYLEKYPKNFCITGGPQNLRSSLGKIMMIDLLSKKNKFISTGHNNPQGITYHAETDVIFSTEHGPQGGDEININDFKLDIDEKIRNYGWPISSYGEHYGFPNEDIKYLYEMAPLYKSHKKYNFIEPIDYFVPSIGISDIQSYKNKLFVGSMGSSAKEGDLSLYVYEIDKNNQIRNKKKILLNQRIRDLHIINDYLYLYLESTGTIALLNLKNFN